MALPFELSSLARENGCALDEYTCSRAAENGHLDCLKYVHENSCSWDTLTCYMVAANGHLGCLKYAHENDCPWDWTTCSLVATKGPMNIPIVCQTISNVVARELLFEYDSRECGPARARCGQSNSFPARSLPNAGNQSTRHSLAVCFPVLAILRSTTLIDTESSIEQQHGEVDEVQVRKNTRKASW